MNTRFKDKSTFRYFVFFTIILSFLLRLASLAYHDLIVEEAYYWNYSAHLDYSFLDHPPMVAILIKIGTTLFGTNEFGVRILSLLCWIGMAYYSYKLTDLIYSGAGLYSVFLLSFLPFFFLHSIIITPDQPLTLCWVAALYYLYQALVQEKSSAWYGAGIWIGLGMLSKYSIVLLGIATLLYCVFIPSARYWLKRFTPYFAIIIAIIIFTPVIYWNVTHDWASFIFQGPRRLQLEPKFTFHLFLGLLITFLLPIGLIEFGQLFQSKASQKISKQSQLFMLIFACLPLIVFSLFSLSRQIKFNWIGPPLLALIPWFAVSIKTGSTFHYRSWVTWAIILPIVYIALFIIIAFGYPPKINSYFYKFINWTDFTNQVYQIASEVDQRNTKKPIFISLDPYRLNSEIAFYGAKAFMNKKNSNLYPVAGCEFLERESLMYRYWSTSIDLSNKTLILIGYKLSDFNNLAILNKIKITTPVTKFWSRSQYRNNDLHPLYYAIGELQ